MDRLLRSCDGEVIVTLDCDGTYPASDIPRLARLVLDDGFDVVDGSRLRQRPAAMPLLNYLANAGFAALASVLFGRRLTDLHSGMRAYRRDMIEELRYDPAGPALPVDLLLIPLRQGKRLKTVFITYDLRIGTSTMRPLPSAWWTLKRIVLTRFGTPAADPRRAGPTRRPLHVGDISTGGDRPQQPAPAAAIRKVGAAA